MILNFFNLLLISMYTPEIIVDNNRDESDLRDGPYGYDCYSIKDNTA